MMGGENVSDGKTSVLSKSKSRIRKGNLSHSSGERKQIKVADNKNYMSYF